MFKSKREKELEEKLADTISWNKNLRTNLRMRDKLLGKCQEFIETIREEIDKPFEGYEGMSFKYHSFSDKELEAANKIRQLEEEIQRLNLENKLLKEELKDAYNT